MQQFLSTLWLGNEGPLVQLLVYGAIALAVLLVLFILYRVLFAHRLRLPGGGRARQPRLGLVDAFSLDGQRQLVLVRRDNIEHLVMIGGPNDVVIESQIIRAVATPPAQPAARDREAPPPAAPKPQPAAPPPIANAIARTTPRPEPALTKPPAPAPAPAAPRFEPPRAAPPTAPLRPAPPAPPRPVTPTIRPAPLPAPIAASGGPSSPPRQPPPAFAPQSAASESKPAVTESRPTVVTTPPRVVPSPVAPVAQTPIAPPAGPSQGPAAKYAAHNEPAPKEPAPKEDEFDGLDSLEAEMSRLLGREN